MKPEYRFKKTLKKGVIRIHKSKKDRHYNGQKKMDKRTSNDLLNIRPAVKSCDPEG